MLHVEKENPKQECFKVNITVHSLSKPRLTKHFQAQNVSLLGGSCYLQQKTDVEILTNLGFEAPTIKMVNRLMKVDVNMRTCFAGLHMVDMDLCCKSVLDLSRPYIG